MIVFKKQMPVLRLRSVWLSMTATSIQFRNLCYRNAWYNFWI